MFSVVHPRSQPGSTFLLVGKGLRPSVSQKNLVFKGVHTVKSLELTVLLLSYIFFAISIFYVIKTKKQALILCLSFYLLTNLVY